MQTAGKKNWGRSVDIPNALFYFFKINIISCLCFGRRIRCSTLRGESLLLFHLFLHFTLHFTETLFDLTTGHVHRYHQFKDEIV